VAILAGTTMVFAATVRTGLLNGTYPTTIQRILRLFIWIWIDTTNGVGTQLIAANAADYDVANWTDPVYGGVAKLGLTLSLPAMRRLGSCRDAQLLSSELIGARPLPDGTIEASTHEVWLDHTVSATTGNVVIDQSGDIQQTYTLSEGASIRTELAGARRTMAPS
jgi:hypothetical protein